MVHARYIYTHSIVSGNFLQAPVCLRELGLIYKTVATERLPLVSRIGRGAKPNWVILRNANAVSTVDFFTLLAFAIVIRYGVLYDTGLTRRIPLSIGQHVTPNATS